ncbi:CapA family protein [Cohnella caldifontis]|uniref:CapA family protein n=1 Tax=Cohnella caldifontis TaxID=3027471 RepID=UPI0023ECA15C|nr:CapA family protein [Cohnella sp. YIM B05605]
MDNRITLMAVGDVGPNRKDPDSIFEYAAPGIRQADVAFCQLEPALSRRGTPLPQARLPMRADPGAAGAIGRAGFHVASFASNHCMDWGREALQDTIDALREQGLQVIGAGRNLSEARAPAIVERRGVRVAFLAYNSILPQGYWAESDRPGCAPLRAHTLYEQIEHDQPGTPARVLTYPHRGDLRAMEEDVSRAKSLADVVVVSMHWGIHFVPAVLSDYQKELAYAAIDAGADLIAGHHPHILKGIEVYRGKAIFYSLGNFALESPFTFAENLAEKESHREIARLNPEFGKGGAELPPDTFMSIAVRCSCSDRGVERVAFQPVMIDRTQRPEPLAADDPRFGDIVRYVERISKDQGLPFEYTVEGDEAVVACET